MYIEAYTYVDLCSFHYICARIRWYKSPPVFTLILVLELSRRKAYYENKLIIPAGSYLIFDSSSLEL